MLNRYHFTISCENNWNRKLNKNFLYVSLTSNSKKNMTLKLKNDNFVLFPLNTSQFWKNTYSKRVIFLNEFFITCMYTQWHNLQFKISKIL